MRINLNGNYKIFALNENENRIYQNGRIQSEINNLSIYLRKLRKKEKFKHTAS